MNDQAGGGEPLEAFPSRAQAEEARWRWGELLVQMGLERTHGIAVRLIREDERHACWGVFAEPRDD